MPVQNVFLFLKDNVTLFKDFPDDKLKQLVEGSRLTTFEPNEAVIEFGEEGHFLGVLIDGEAQVSNTDDSGQLHHLKILKAGDIFGEMSIMTGDRTVADVIGLSRCTALLIPQSLFSTILVTHPGAIRFLSKTITERLKAVLSDDQGKTLEGTVFKRSQDPYGFRLQSDTPEKILVINCGSSSLKYQFFDTADESRNAQGTIEKIGENGTKHSFQTQSQKNIRELPKSDYTAAFTSMIEELTTASVIRAKGEISAVGHRVVHGGDRFGGAEILTDEVIKAIDDLSSLAPLHNPVNLTGIREAKIAFPNATHVAVFDTAFHHTLPPYAYLYGLPYEYYEKDKIRRYGFHGMSHSYVALKGSQFVKRPFNELEIVSCHLGNGASVCAIDHGRSIDTSMGMTPVDGLIMGTRSGSIDPAALIHIMKKDNLSAQQAEEIITRKSGLLGISGLSNDMRAIEKAAQDGDHRSLLAIKTFCYQIRKYIGAYVAAMGGLDLIVFTGGIGQGSAGVRSFACQGLGYMGIHIDENRNRNADGFTDVCDISTNEAPVRTLVIPANEELMIARETLRALGRKHILNIISTRKPIPIPVEVSAHHVHLSQEHVEALFGPGHKLTCASELSQPGQFACAEKVTLIGPKGRIERVRVLGPARKETQIEIAMTEQFKLGIHPPVRESGDLTGTPPVTLEGDKGSITIEKGVICALRHIHMPPEDALSMGLGDRCMVRVLIDSAGRDLIFGDVLIRVHPSFRLAMHIDTDEANAAGIITGMTGHIESIQNQRN